MPESKSYAAAMSGDSQPTDSLSVTDLIDPSKVVRSEDVEQEGGFTF